MIQIFCNYVRSDYYFDFSHRKMTGPSDMLVNHIHPRYEVYYLLSGKRNYFIKDKTYLINKGNMVFISPQEIHKTTDPTAILEHERIVFHFKKEFIVPDSFADSSSLLYLFTSNKHVISLGTQEQHYIENMFLKMIQEVKNKQLGFEEYLRSMVIQVLLYIGRYMEQNNTGSLEQPVEIYSRFSEIVKYINNHYMEDLTLSFLSNHFFISRYHLSRTFKEATGFTFIEYINSLRVKEAQKFLRETKYKLPVIAEKVGFGSVVHFSRMFKKISGFSPLHYRQISKE